MSMSFEELEAEALELSLEERARLAKRLLDSIDEPPAADEAASIDQAWYEESEIVVVAIAHHRRRPGYWQRRLK
ncbi:MAG: addiction module protein [Candidatus Schekmanbacteria bacterium]|nr:addiction module protein [Candidatus Schekmanbacteria bacterium]